jgi:ABC-type nitrate/sulfonate/bicarbonate transport system permease component
MRKRWPGFVFFGGILLTWQVLSATNLVDPVVLPRVSSIISALVNDFANGELPRQLLPTLWRVFAGFSLAALIAVPLGLLMGTVPFVYRLLEPTTEFMRPIPSSAYIPVAILFLGIENEMKIFVVILSCIFPILLNTYSGVRGIDVVLIDTGRTFGVSRIKNLVQIISPAALPSIFTGMRISLGLALIVSVVAEMIAGNSGIGYFILNMQNIFHISEMYAGIFTLGVVGFLINFLFLKAEAYFLRWRGTSA